MQKIEQFTLDESMSNADYHAQRPIEDHFFSSSQLKTILESPEKFHEKYLCNGASEPTPAGLQAAFDTGSYYHTSILEPHLLEEECVIWPGKVRAGAKWKEFKEEHSGKAILTKSDVAKANILIKGTKDNPLSMKIYTGGKAETSLFVTYHVDVEGSAIYLKTPKKNFKLTSTGWASIPKSIKLSEDLVPVQIKVRCDYRQQTLGYISDLKSTTGDPKNDEAILHKIKMYQYEFSACLYLDAFNAQLLYEGGVSDYQDFIWTFATKDYAMAQDWVMSKAQHVVGRAKEMTSIILLAKHLRDGWTFPPKINVCGVDDWEFKKWAPAGSDYKELTRQDNPLCEIIANFVIADDEVDPPLDEALAEAFARLEDTDELDELDGL
ncbi:MAG: PD-(D/E)XK nuclease-like domain-containing protein [Bacteriovoracaceae bacterium]|nr:PD-(D/E)XK nuclease-like domain-containing protein [Bacteriovoracaceae bacterium]